MALNKLLIVSAGMEAGTWVSDVNMNEKQQVVSLLHLQ